MQAGRLVRWARQHTRQSQRALAARTGVAQSTISRIEDGRFDPHVGTLRRLLRACGYDLELTPALGFGVDRGDIRAQLGRAPDERLRHSVTAANNLRRWRSTARKIGPAAPASA